MTNRVFWLSGGYLVSIDQKSCNVFLSFYFKYLQMTYFPFFQCATSGFTNMGKSSDGDVAKLLKKSNLCVFWQRNIEMFPDMGVRPYSARKQN